MEKIANIIITKCDPNIFSTQVTFETPDLGLIEIVVFRYIPAALNLTRVIIDYRNFAKSVNSLVPELVADHGKHSYMSFISKWNSFFERKYPKQIMPGLDTRRSSGTINVDLKNVHFDDDFIEIANAYLPMPIEDVWSRWFTISSQRRDYTDFVINEFGFTDLEFTNWCKQDETSPLQPVAEMTGTPPAYEQIGVNWHRMAQYKTPLNHSVPFGKSI